jgi:hypothetical protein
VPLQNRVDPCGKLIAVNARGSWLGNRGILHNERKEIIAPWRHKAWVTCQLVFRGRKRQIFSLNNYSELFFLDEATAFSAGHRPCAECRKERYKEFKGAWLNANAEVAALSLPVAQIDKQLHSERAVRGGKKVTYSTEFNNVPFGTFIQRKGNAYLYWQGKLKEWSPNGYLETGALPEPSEVVTVLTPLSIVRIYENGFRPQVHESASS